MRQIQEMIHRRTTEFEGHPFYQFIRDTSIDPRQRLSFVPALAHFVMSFADLYRLVLRDEPAKDRLQELVNAHTYEDGGHWKWFLSDLDKLGQDAALPFSQALRFVWSEGTVRTRMLSYEMCRFGIGADSLQKLVLVQCIEATGKVTLSNIAPVGKELSERLGKSLVYFGAHHFDTESDHTLEKDEPMDFVDNIEVPSERVGDLLAMVDKTFALFSAGADELLVFAKSGVGIKGA